jgi:hypothetical protein
MEEGQVVWIGRKFKLHSANPAYKYSIENASSTFSVPYRNIYNHNAAAVYRLSAPGDAHMHTHTHANTHHATMLLRAGLSSLVHVMSIVSIMTHHATMLLRAGLSSLCPWYLSRVYLSHIKI